VLAGFNWGGPRPPSAASIGASPTAGQVSSRALSNSAHESGRPGAYSGTVMTSQPSAVTAEYRALHKYLVERFADIVVLTFNQIEDLLGHPLPELARAEREWWANPAAESVPSVQSLAWTQASRTATANLRACTVAFERRSA
jgi:hypothetical protein